MEDVCLTSANANNRYSDTQLEELIQQISTGGKDALSELYHQASPAVYGFAISILKNEHDAEDVLHDCFLRIYSFAGSYKPKGKPMAWILTITKNLCYSKLGQQRGDTQLELLENQLGENPMTSAEDRAVISACMRLLTDEERQIVSLHAVGGLKHREIARMLSLPVSTVLSKYNRALKKLRAQLEKGE